MKKTLFKTKIMLIVTLAAMAVSSVSLSLIPLTSGIEVGKNNTFSYVIAAVFWLGIIVLAVSTVMTSVFLRKCKSELSKDIKTGIQKLPGIICFSLNKFNSVIYSVAAVGIILIALEIIFSFIPEAVMFPILSVTLLSVMLHCFADGKNYKVYKLIKENMDNETKH